MQKISTTVQNVFKNTEKIKVLIDFLCGSSLFFLSMHEVSKQPTRVNKWVDKITTDNFSSQILMITK